MTGMLTGDVGDVSDEVHETTAQQKPDGSRAYSELWFARSGNISATYMNFKYAKQSKVMFIILL